MDMGQDMFRAETPRALLGGVLALAFVLTVVGIAAGQDETPPSIFSASLYPQYVGVNSFFLITASVSDDVGVETVIALVSGSDGRAGRNLPGRHHGERRGGEFRDGECGHRRAGSDASGYLDSFGDQPHRPRRSGRRTDRLRHDHLHVRRHRFRRDRLLRLHLGRRIHGILWELLHPLRPDARDARPPGCRRGPRGKCRFYARPVHLDRAALAERASPVMTWKPAIRGRPRGNPRRAPPPARRLSTWIRRSPCPPG